VTATAFRARKIHTQNLKECIHRGPTQKPIVPPLMWRVLDLGRRRISQGPFVISDLMTCRANTKSRREVRNEYQGTNDFVHRPSALQSKLSV
jgi:hypothetical protein